jgi:glycosyltransferase involved in cell wall biosynthesis
MARVDVFIPYWGEFLLLKEAVESVLGSEYTDFRVVIVDDCYPDKTAYNYFRDFADARVKYIRHRKNIGISANFNFCLARVEAEYFVMMGCDDKMLPNYLGRAVAKMRGVDFYQGGVGVIDIAGREYLPLGDRAKRFLSPSKAGVYGGEKLAQSLVRGNWLYFPAILWRSARVRKYEFNDKYKIVEDVELELSIIADGGKMYFDRERGFLYRRFDGSLSSVEKKGVRFREEDEIYERFAKRFFEMGWRKAAWEARMRIASRVNRIFGL